MTCRKEPTDRAFAEERPLAKLRRNSSIAAFGVSFSSASIVSCAMRPDRRSPPTAIQARIALLALVRSLSAHAALTPNHSPALIWMEIAALQDFF
jgi:hypothetical protein